MLFFVSGITKKEWFDRPVKAQIGHPFDAYLLSDFSWPKDVPKTEAKLKGGAGEE